MSSKSSPTFSPDSVVEPLTPHDCDLQDFQFMPLDVSRLRDSDLAADETPEACWAAVLLWSASWHQVPAASIPDNDVWIAKQAGYAQRGKIDKDWARVRTGALRGWIKCDDGRLYHPVVAEKAMEAWRAKMAQRWRSECARIKKHNQRHENANVPMPDFDDWISQGRPAGQPLPVPGDKTGQVRDKAGDTRSKRQGEGQGQGDLKLTVPNGTGADAPPAGLSSVDAVFQIAVPWLVERGMADKAARSLLGAARKQLGDDGAWTLASDCMHAAPFEPASWLAAALNARMDSVKGKGGASEKFAVAGADHGSSRAAMDAAMARRGIVVADDETIPL